MILVHHPDINTCVNLGRTLVAVSYTWSVIGSNHLKIESDSSKKVIDIINTVSDTYLSVMVIILALLFLYDLLFS